jgi:transcriptional regulator with XRE-family HTH domain
MEHPAVINARELLNKCRGSWAAVEKQSGVSYSWLSKFARAEINNPQINTLQAVSDACTRVLVSTPTAE